jgi:alpha-amylase
MTLIVPYFFAHQPFRLRAADERRSSETLQPDQLHDFYFDDTRNREIFLQVAARCYIPATNLLLDMIRKTAGDEKPFRVALGLSGTLLMQAQRWAPELLDLWKALADSGQVEFTGESYYQSLAGLFEDGYAEFCAEATQHRDAIQTLFGQTPQVFRATEMLCNNAIAECVQTLGFRGMMTEGVDWLMAGWRSPDFVYASPSGLPILLRNYRLSDDIGYRFADKTWDGYPLTAEKYTGWLARNTDPVVLLALDFEALGEHLAAGTGIFDFLAALPAQAAQYPLLEWATPSEAIARIAPAGQVDIPTYSTISWSHRERDTSAWIGNEMQQFCFEEMKRLEPLLPTNDDSALREAWRLMLTSDQLHAICDKSASGGNVHQYFSAYGTVVESFVRLHTALYDLKRRAEQISRG